MGFLESLLTKIIMGLVEKLASFLLGRAKASKLHSDDKAGLKTKAKAVQKQAEIIQGAIRKKQIITKEMAAKLKARNAKLRSGGLFN